MPFEIQPLYQGSTFKSYDLTPGGDWDWLGKQEFSYERAWKSTTAKARGKVAGGPSLEQMWSSLDDPRKFTILPAPPPITSPILTGERLGPTTRMGTVELDLIDPFATISQATGAAIGRDRPLIGEEASWFDPGAFLASKQIDIFGTGDVGVPARLADYAFALPIALMNKLNGVTSSEPSANSGLRYRFQQDPSYWALLGNGVDDDDLRNLAVAVAGRYIDPYRNQMLVNQLVDQFKRDRDMLTGLSSGNDRIDYLAKMRFAYEAVSRATANAAPFSEADWATSAVGVADFAAQLTTAIPFFGTQLAETVAPIPDNLEAMWRSLSPDERRAYLGGAGGRAMILDVAVMLPAFSGINAALSVAKASTGLAGTLYKGYDTTLRTMNAMMATGITVATANWALSAAVPGYSDFLGKEIDYARPVSKSALAGLVNELGFWSSGTFGIATAGKAYARVAGKGLSGLHVPNPVGTQELGFFRYGYGGSAVRGELERAGLSPQLIDTSVKASFLSHVLNWVERQRRRPYEAAIAGGDTPWDDVNLMSIDERQAWANDQLSRSMVDGPEAAESFLRILQSARAGIPINPSDITRQAARRAKDLARTLDDMLAADVVDEYGAGFIASRRVAGAYTEEAMEAWARGKVTELGGDGTRLGRHDREGWAQIVRTLHQVEYHRWAGELAAAVEREAADEGRKLAIIRSDHLFRADAEDAIAALDGGAEPAAIVRGLIETRREAAEWFAREWRPAPGVDRTPDAVPPSVFRDWLEDVLPALPTKRQNAAAGAETAMLPINALQRAIDEQGTWTLAFKPVNEAGDFVSYSRTRGGGIFKSPWVEYPLGAVDNLELGNRGWMAGKLDSVFRGFRTWRLTEFQRGSLFRSLTGRFTFLPEQIDAFHSGLLTIARDARIQPQTAGALAKLPEMPFAIQTAERIQRLADETFGSGPYRGLDGQLHEVDWPAEVTRAYSQSFRLNLTAGLTSHLKDRLGTGGAMVAYASDIIYVAWRFGLSPLFKGGEIVESRAFNALKGVFRSDPTTEALFVRGGLGNDVGILNSEMAYDQLIGALGSPGKLPDANARLAASLSLHARRIPSDFRLEAEIASTQGVAEEFVQAHGGGGLIVPQRKPPAPGAQVSRLEDMPPEFTTDPRTFMPAWFDETMSDMEVADLGLWHATTNIDAVLEQGLKSRRELSDVVKPPLYELDEVARGLLPDDAPAGARVTVADLRKAGVTDDELAELVATYPDRFSRASTGGKNRKITQGAYFEVPGDHDTRLDYYAPGPVVEVTERIGLGGGLVDLGHNVSTTVREDHAATIANTLRLAARAARGEVTADEILDYFTDFQGYRHYEWDPGGMAAHIEGIRTDHESWVSLVEELGIRYPAGKGDDLYWLVKQLDNGLRAGEYADEFSGHVGLTADTVQMARIDPAQIGYVKVGARFTGDPDVDTFGVARVGPDTFELQFNSKNLWVIDDRPDLPPIATGNKDELLRQLRATMATEPTPIQHRENALTRELNDIVGENGIAPGLELRAKEILDELDELERMKGDGGPVLRWTDLSERQQAEWRHRLLESGDLPVDLASQPGELEEAFARFQRRPGNTDNLADVAGTPEALFETIMPAAAERAIAGGAQGWMKRAWQAFWHPTPGKQARSLELQIRLMETEFPALLRASGNDGLVQVFRELGIPENKWATWLLEDRRLLDEFLNARTPEALDALTRHAGDDVRPQFDELYQSEEWLTLTSLWSLNLKAAQDEAFGVHFFMPYRSAFERSINHPVLGVYPASWALKAARQWAAFLFDNRTFGELRLGMAPAQAIANLSRDQAAQFAMNDDQTLEEYLEDGPLGSTIFIFNLLMPGDWSALPFPLSRTIRELIRGNHDPGAILRANVEFMGVTRDFRLFGESIGEIRDLLLGPEEEPEAAIERWSARGSEGIFGQPRR